MTSPLSKAPTMAIPTAPLTMTPMRQPTEAIKLGWLCTHGSECISGIGASNGDYGVVCVPDLFCR